MSAVVQVRGARELRRSLRRAGDDLADLKDAHARVAAMVAGAAAARAPRRTGRLAADVRGAGTKTPAIVRVGRKSVPYAGPIHWGWPARGIRANPFHDRGRGHRNGVGRHLHGRRGPHH